MSKFIVHVRMLIESDGKRDAITAASAVIDLEHVALLAHRRGALCVASHWVVLVEQHGCQAAAHVPFEIVGKHAEQHMRAHPWCGPMVYRAEFQIDGFHRTEGTLDNGEALVGSHGRSGIGLRGRQIGAHHVNAVECGLGGDGGLVPVEAERVVGDGDVEVFGHLALAEYGAECLADGRRSTQRVTGSPHSGANARQIPCRGKHLRSLGRVGGQAPCREATLPIRQPRPEPPQRVRVRLPAAIAQSPR